MGFAERGDQQSNLTKIDFGVENMIKLISINNGMRVQETKHGYKTYMGLDIQKNSRAPR